MVELNKVTKTYIIGKTRIHALRGIDLRIEPGEMLVVGGVSGSGKSTLLNLLGAMDRPTDGTILVDGMNITNFSNAKLTHFRARKVGFIFQSFNLVPTLNVYENIVVPMRLKGQRFDKKKVIGLIETVGLLSHMHHRPDELSGGQKQRVAIARSLVHNPPYILADEPTANLDSATAKSIVELLKQVNRDLKVTIIFASHDQCVLQIISRKILLKDGMIL